MDSFTYFEEPPQTGPVFTSSFWIPVFVLKSWWLTSALVTLNFNFRNVFENKLQPISQVFLGLANGNRINALKIQLQKKFSLFVVYILFA